MLMGTHPNFRGNSTPFEYATSHAMQDAWVAFAKDGTQGLESTGWSEQDISLAGLEGKCNGAVPAR
jgi:cholinesterase